VDRPDVTMMFVVHNAFRRDLARMQAAAAGADDPATRNALRAGWATFSRYLTIHHVAEDEVLWPPMRAKLRGRADETHLTQGSASHLVVLFGDLAAILTGHLDHEEADALPLVRETLTAAEWKAFGDDQRRRVGVSRAAWFFPWLLDGTTPDVQATVLAIVPAPLRLVYRLIWEPRYRRRSPWHLGPSNPLVQEDS
jgi:hypothetical protein